MNDEAFKSTLIKAIELDPTTFAYRTNLCATLLKSNVYIEYTSLFTRIEWNTYCAILHIQAPVDKYEFVKTRERIIDSIAKKIFGRQGDHFLTETEIGIIVETNEVFDFSAIKATEVIEKAIVDAEVFMAEGKYTSAFDRVHTAVMGYFRKKLNDLSVSYEESDTLGQLYNKIHEHIAKSMTTNIGSLMKTAIRSASGVISSINELRNRHSLAHPNDELITDKEAKLCINMAKTITDYIESVL